MLEVIIGSILGSSLVTFVHIINYVIPLPSTKPASTGGAIYTRVTQTANTIAVHTGKLYKTGSVIQIIDCYRVCGSRRYSVIVT